MKDRVDLICSIGELAGLFEKTTSLDSFLQTAVSIVAYHMRAAVCSVYLYDEKSGELVMTANQGLALDAANRVRLKLGEGITGTAVKELRPIREGVGTRSQFWKPVSGIAEEKYQAFLAVPIVRGLTRIGALVVQDPVADYFDDNDTKALQAIAAQLASVIENAKLLMTLGRHSAAEPPPPASGEPLKFLHGQAGAAGIGIGRAMVFGSLDEVVPHAHAAHTREDFDRALDLTEKQLEALQVQMEERLADVASLIFSAHILMMKDAKFTGAMATLIDSGQTPASAITRVVDQYARLFAGSKNPRLREKELDVRDLGRRLLKNLGSAREEEVDYCGHVVIAGEVLPSDVLRIAAQRAGGLVLTGGGANSHVAILARSLQLPMVIVENDDLLALHEDTLLLIDGGQGALHVNPDEEVVQRYRALMQSAREADDIAGRIPAVATTSDGVAVDILANINMLSEVALAKRYKAAGVGLYRSEFPFIVRNDFPSEEEQFRIYRKLIDDLEGRPATLRTLDVGGDKILSYFPGRKEANPFLGLRAIRFSLRYRDIFERQLRALLRAGHERTLSIMFPLISSVDEFIEARRIVGECGARLAEEGVPHQAAPRLGAMIELPAAVEIVDELAAAADFLSIGGNDLVQYMLAVDRTNEHLADFYLPHHPAVLRAIARVAGAAARHGKPLSFCGEMATDPRILPFLLGVGIRRVSVEARQIPAVHQVIAGLSMAGAAAKAKHLLALGRIDEVAAVLAAGP